jgi:large subunit ribosomal protein L18e
MISKTKISKRARKKTNSELGETMLLAKKENLEIAKILSSPTRKRMKMNLEEINKETKDGETVIIPGKVLGQGDLDKKVKIIALSFSSSAEEKLKKSKCEARKLIDELKKDKKLKGRILK